MFTLQNSKQTPKSMEENSNNSTLVTKLLDSHSYILSQINHELRNPLTILSSKLQLIEKQHPEVAEYTHWSSLADDIQFMETLLEDLSLYNHGKSIRKQLIPTSDFLNHISASYASTIADTPINFSSKIDPKLPAISGDPIKLKQLLFNLFRNASEATSNKGKIQFTAVQGTNQIIIKITDNGPGIPSSHLSDIFTPFSTYKKNGTGLGLAIVKSIIEAHDGTIHVESIPFRNTTFTVSLPIDTCC